jgi:hypothetical protein
MVGIIDLLAQCKLLAAEARDPQQCHKCTSDESARLLCTLLTSKRTLDLHQGNAY